jgi:opacity protein-like surface antigen
VSAEYETPYPRIGTLESSGLAKGVVLGKRFKQEYWTISPELVYQQFNTSAKDVEGDEVVIGYRMGLNVDFSYAVSDSTSLGVGLGLSNFSYENNWYSVGVDKKASDTSLTLGLGVTHDISSLLYLSLEMMLASITLEEPEISLGEGYETSVSAIMFGLGVKL